MRHRNFPVEYLKKIVEVAIFATSHCWPFYDFAGVLAVDGDPVADVHAVTGVHALDLVYGVAGSRAVAGVSSVAAWSYCYR
jgi:hypothetical protein